METDLTLAQAEIMQCARDLPSHCRQFNPNSDRESLFTSVTDALERVGVNLQVIHDSAPLITELFEQEGVN
uniref:hypothetical protein n=1 Tax=Synechococcus sp. UW106 TaxID=368495 RepID=UPI000E0EB29C|nr:hypothetical protein [Synechococcus sp. UW106]